MGQNFIRKYNLTLKFTRPEDVNKDISLSVFIGRANPMQSLIPEAVLVTVTSFALFAYVGCFSVMKFRRIKSEKAEFNKIKNGVEKVYAD